MAGETWRWIFGAQLDSDVWRADFYWQYYDWFMQSNPTYDSQLNQFDKRWTTGGRYDRTLFENDRVKVWEMDLAPGESSDFHEHSHTPRVVSWLRSSHVRHWSRVSAW